MTPVNGLLIGFGAVGRSLRPLLQQQGFLFNTIVDPHVQNTDEFFTSIQDLPDDLSWDIILIAVRDAEIESVVNELNEKYNAFHQVLCFHTSGAIGWKVLAPLQKKEAAIGSAHPLMTFQKKKEMAKMEHVPVSVSGDRNAVLQLKEIFSSIGWVPVELPEEKKIFFHLLGVLASNFQLALLDAIKKILVGGHLQEETVELKHIVPIYEETRHNFFKSEHTPDILSGPVQRRDFVTVLKHLEIIRRDFPELEGIYMEFCRYLAIMDGYTKSELEKLEKHLNDLSL